MVKEISGNDNSEETIAIGTDPFASVNMTQPAINQSLNYLSTDAAITSYAGAAMVPPSDPFSNNMISQHSVHDQNFSQGAASMPSDPFATAAPNLMQQNVTQVFPQQSTDTFTQMPYSQNAPSQYGDPFSSSNSFPQGSGQNSLNGMMPTATAENPSKNFEQMNGNSMQNTINQYTSNYANVMQKVKNAPDDDDDDDFGDFHAGGVMSGGASGNAITDAFSAFD